MRQRLVLGYAGDPQTARAIPELAAAHAADVVTVSFDLGGGNLDEARERALAAGALRGHVLDLREQFAREVMLPALQAGVPVDPADPAAGKLAAPFVARMLAEVAAIEGAMQVIDRMRIDATLWGRRGSRFVWTRAAAEAPATVATLDIAFEAGVPVAVNGVPMTLTELIESVAIIAGHHGVGRVDVDGCGEAPAAIVLGAALAALGSAAGRGPGTGLVHVTLHQGTFQAAPAVEPTAVRPA